jgi:hypothetical protein
MSAAAVPAVRVPGEVIPPAPAIPAEAFDDDTFETLFQETVVNNSAHYFTEDGQRVEDTLSGRELYVFRSIDRTPVSKPPSSYTIVNVKRAVMARWDSLKEDLVEVLSRNRVTKFLLIDEKVWFIPIFTQFLAVLFCVAMALHGHGAFVEGFKTFADYGQMIGDFSTVALSARSAIKGWKTGKTWGDVGDSVDETIWLTFVLLSGFAVFGNHVGWLSRAMMTKVLPYVFAVLFAPYILKGIRGICSTISMISATNKIKNNAELFAYLDRQFETVKADLKKQSCSRDDMQSALERKIGKIEKMLGYELAGKIMREYAKHKRNQKLLSGAGKGSLVMIEKEEDLTDEISAMKCQLWKKLAFDVGKLVIGLASAFFFIGSKTKLFSNRSVYWWGMTAANSISFGAMLSPDYRIVPYRPDTDGDLSGGEVEAPAADDDVVASE